MKGRSGTSPQQSHTKERREAKDNHFTTAHNSSQHHKNSYQDTGEISVCSLWMHIRSLRMAIQRLWMHIPRLRTKIAVRCVNNCSTLHKQSQHAAQAIAARCQQDCTTLRESPHPFGGIHSFPSDCRRTLQERRRKQESTAQPTLCEAKRKQEPTAQPTLCEAKRKQEHSTRKSFSQQETPSCPEEKEPFQHKRK